MLSGKFEVVKHFDGVERTLGWRLPGTIFGEVPLAFATPFPGGYRAAEPSRVMRVEPHHYFAIASSAPEVAERVGALARERIGGLQGIAMQPPKAQVTVYGERWEPACSEVRRFLSRNQIVHDWLTPQTPDLARSWRGGIRCQRRAAHAGHRARGTGRAGRHVFAYRELPGLSERCVRR